MKFWVLSLHHTGCKARYGDTYLPIVPQPWKQGHKDQKLKMIQGDRVLGQPGLHETLSLLKDMDKSASFDIKFFKK